MPYTHDFELKVGDYEFSGECEYTDAGILAYTENGADKMSARTERVIKDVLELLGPLPEKYTDLEKFELVIKS